MIVLDLLGSICKLGLPMAGLSWFVFSRLYNVGDMDRKADRKAVKQKMKVLAAAFKTSKKTKAESKVNFVHDKWMWFGGGFYGLAALWTFAAAEAQDIYNFTFHNPGSEVLLNEGLIGLIINIAVNQLQNIVTAFLWFGYWNADSVLALVLIAYGGYWLGVEIARRNTQLPVSSMVSIARNKLSELLKTRNS